MDKKIIDLFMFNNKTAAGQVLEIINEAIDNAHSSAELSVHIRSICAALKNNTPDKGTGLFVELFGIIATIIEHGGLDAIDSRILFFEMYLKMLEPGHLSEKDRAYFKKEIKKFPRALKIPFEQLLLYFNRSNPERFTVHVR